MSKEASSGDRAFFQCAPIVPNQLWEDESLSRNIQPTWFSAFAIVFLPRSIRESVQDDLDRFASEVLSKEVTEWIADAELHPPYVRTHDAFGNRIDELIASAGWQKLQAFGIKEGIVALGYQFQHGAASRLLQFFKYHLWTASSAFVICPSAMQDGAAALLATQLSSKGVNDEKDQKTREVFENAFRRLTSWDPNVAWTSGQWMTERAGGSDVSMTETVARPVLRRHEVDNEDAAGSDAHGNPLGPWCIDGFKFYSSATDCQMAILLARTRNGLSCFYAPTRRRRRRRQTEGGRGNGGGGSDTEMNGIRIQRLKNKLGTRPVPTAELELRGLRAYLVGNEGEGVKVISSVLNIARLHNAVTSVGLLGRGLAIARSYANVRSLGQERGGGGRLLRSVPLFARSLAETTVTYRAYMLFVYFVAFLLGLVEHPDRAWRTHDGDSFASRFLRPDSLEDAAIILRLLTPVVKACSAKAAVAGLQECMEAMGGVGYMENTEDQRINVARLFRDANVLSIWEGTTNVLAANTLSVLKHPKHADAYMKALLRWVEKALPPSPTAHHHNNTAPSTLRPLDKDLLRKEVEAFSTLLRTRDAKGLEPEARQLMFRLCHIVCAVLLFADAERDADPAAEEIARRWFERTVGEGELLSARLRRERRVETDVRIAFGDTSMSATEELSRL